MRDELDGIALAYIRASKRACTVARGSTARCRDVLPHQRYSQAPASGGAAYRDRTGRRRIDLDADRAGGESHAPINRHHRSTRLSDVGAERGHHDLFELVEVLRRRQRRLRMGRRRRQQGRDDERDAVDDGASDHVAIYTRQSANKWLTAW